MIQQDSQPRILAAAALAVALLLALVPAEPVRAQEPDLPDSLGAAVDSTVVRAIDPQVLSFAAAQADIWDTGISPTTAVLMTPLFPGWGQLYAENSWRAALAYGTQMYFWTNVISRDRQARRARDFAGTFEAGDANRTRYDNLAGELWEQMRDFAWWSGGVLLIVALDAYVGAHLFNFDQDPVPVPNRFDEQFGPPGGDMPGGRLSTSYTVFQWRTTF